MNSIAIIGITGLPEIKRGQNIASLIAAAASSIALIEGDAVVIAQKIVSKAEGRTVALDSIEPSAFARQWAGAADKDPRLVEVILQESRRVIRMDQGVLICETHHGFVCANAGVDASNTEEGTVTLLPADPDRSAQLIRRGLEERFGTRVAVVISDTFGRPWREGLVNVALGVSGIAPLKDYRGKADWTGKTLNATTMAIADEIASAAELVMGKSSGVPAAIVRGADYETREASALELVRPRERDLFR